MKNETSKIKKEHEIDSDFDLVADQTEKTNENETVYTPLYLRDRNMQTYG